MKLLLDGVEVPWPAKVEIVVDPAGEKAAPLLIEVRGGWLHVPPPPGYGGALTVVADGNGAGLSFGDFIAAGFRPPPPVAGGAFDVAAADAPLGRDFPPGA